MFKRIIPIVAVLVFLVACMVVPASAAMVDGKYLNYNDFITDVQVEGENDLITCFLPLRLSEIYVTDTVNSKESIFSYGTGNLSGNVPGGDEQYAIYFFSVRRNGNRMACTNIPDGSTLTFNYNVYFETGSVQVDKPKATIYIEYYDEAGLRIGEQHQFLGRVDIGEQQTGSIVMQKIPGAVSMRCFIYMFDIRFADVSSTISVSCSMQPTILNMVVNSDQRFYELMDGILDNPVKPSPPSGSGSIGDSINSENGLVNGYLGGKDDFLDIVGDSFDDLTTRTNSIRFLSACLSPFLNIDFVRDIFRFSISFGVLAFLMNLGASRFVHATRDTGSYRASKSVKGG